MKKLIRILLTDAVKDFILVCLTIIGGTLLICILLFLILIIISIIL